MGFAAFIPLIAAGIQAGGNIAAAKLGKRGGRSESLFDLIGPILEADARRREELLDEPIRTPPFNPNAPIGVPALDDVSRIGGLDLLGLIKRRAFGRNSGDGLPF